MRSLQISAVKWFHCQKRNPDYLLHNRQNAEAFRALKGMCNPPSVPGVCLRVCWVQSSSPKSRLWCQAWFPLSEKEPTHSGETHLSWCCFWSGPPLNSYDHEWMETGQSIESFALQLISFIAMTEHPITAEAATVSFISLSFFWASGNKYQRNLNSSTWGRSSSTECRGQSSIMADGDLHHMLIFNQLKVTGGGATRTMSSTNLSQILDVTKPESGQK